MALLNTPINLDKFDSKYIENKCQIRDMKKKVLKLCSYKAVFVPAQRIT